MKKYLKFFKQCANLSSEGAMESGDHFKNGASPKSLTSREKLNHLISYNMKRFTMSLANALMICMILTATFACSKDDNETTPDDPEVPALPPAEIETKSPYKIGDYYNVSGVKGTVFEISNNGQNGKIVSLDEANLAWALNQSIAIEETNARDMDNGMNNMNTIKGISGWKSKYPTFVWCDGKNTNGVTGWYYPAINELKSLYDSWNSIEDALLKYGENFKTRIYTSSTETYSSYYDRYSSSYSLDFGTGNIGKLYSKDNTNFFIRAIRKF
jgi:hypothetical protein